MGEELSPRLSRAALWLPDLLVAAKLLLIRWVPASSLASSLLWSLSLFHFMLFSLLFIHASVAICNVQWILKIPCVRYR